MQCFTHRGGIQRRYGGVADQQHVTAAHVAGQCNAIGQGAWADGDPVGRVAADLDDA